MSSHAAARVPRARERGARDAVVSARAPPPRHNAPAQGALRLSRESRLLSDAGAGVEVSSDDVSHTDLVSYHSGPKLYYV